MRFRKGSCIISPQWDIPLLRQVRNSKFVSQMQLYEILHCDAFTTSRESFDWRVKRLLGAGYIEALEALWWQGSPIFHIARSGLAELESQGELVALLHSQTRNMPERIQVFHSLELNAIRLALMRNALLVDWQSEVEVSSDNLLSGCAYQKDYDAVVKIWSGNEVREFALEYERSLKSSRRYAEVRSALQAERQVPCVLYLTASPGLVLALLHHLTPLAMPIAFATAHSFLEQLLATPVTTDRNRALISLDKFLERAHSPQQRPVAS